MSHHYPDLKASKEMNAVIALSDGTFFLGKGIGKKGTTHGEICFNTGLTGYQETLTDPSYAGQIITFTFPHIGNVGCNEEDMEAQKIFCRGLVIRQDINAGSNFRQQKHLNSWLIEQNLTGICHVDTRALTRNIRTHGARNAIIHYAEIGEKIEIAHLIEQIKDLPTLHGMELAAEVATDTTYGWNEKTFQLGQKEYATLGKGSYHVVAIDYGAKKNILRCLTDVGFDVTVVSAKATFEEIMSYHPDGIFLSNGPGDPFATAEYAVPVIKEILDHNIPLFGICLGNQLLSIASGLSTTKMYQGHRGINHPVKNLENGTVEITSQNHGFCVSKDNVPDTVEITHISLFDGTIEGIKRTDKAAFSVQYHPESSPGPHDSRYLFEKFMDMVKKNNIKSAA